MSIRLRQSLFVVPGDFPTQVCDLQEWAASHKLGNQGISIPLDCTLIGIEGEWRSFYGSKEKLQK